MSYSWPHGIQLEYFQPAEFQHPEEMDMAFLKDLDEIRRRCGRALLVTDDYRTAEENEEIGGASNSAHLRGLAVDVQTIPWTARAKFDLVATISRMMNERQLSKVGLGIYDDHIHIDLEDPELPRPALWSG